MAKKHHYFISFSYGKGPGVWGNASCEIFRYAPITSHDDVVAIGDMLIEKNGYAAICILNWKRFEKKGAKL